MCGICGIVHPDPAYPAGESRLLAMRDSLEHRGPDDAGHHLGPGVGLGSRRLSILDLSERGHMPMATPDGRFTIVHNGEVYNFGALRPALEAQGIRFRSNTDTEVLLWLYATRGAAMLDELNGMFAFAVWDAKERTLFVARDRLGIKPVYYTRHEGALFFASEQKALLAAGCPTSFDESKWEELLSFRFCAGEDTPYSDIKSLLPGHHLTWSEGRLDLLRWWDLADAARAASEERWGSAVSDYVAGFDDSVALRRISDVPLGVFLSGGLDSSSVAATLALREGTGVASFSMGFEEAAFDERPLAFELAQRYALDHDPLEVPQSDIFGLLQRASWFNDEPLAHSNDLYIHAISAYAKPKVTVLLSGEGADETLGGYVRYRPLRYLPLLALSRHWLPPLVRRAGVGGRVGKLARFLELGSDERLLLHNACNVLPEHLVDLGFEPTGDFPHRRALLEAGRRYSPEPVRQMMFYDQHSFLVSLLHRNDRMTMGASIECRVPFLDHRLVARVASMPTRELFGLVRGKHVLRRGMRARLPESILRHPKWGFGVPWPRYIKEIPELRECFATLPDREPVRSGPFDRTLLRKRIEAFLAGREPLHPAILQLLFVSVWHDVTFGRAYSLDPVALPVRAGAH